VNGEFTRTETGNTDAQAASATAGGGSAFSVALGCVSEYVRNKIERETYVKTAAAGYATTAIALAGVELGFISGDGGGATVDEGEEGGEDDECELHDC